MKYYKFMSLGCVGPYSGAKLTPGEWLPPVEGDLVICRNGYHFCKAENFAEWIRDELYSVEVRGEIIEGDDKLCAREIKMTRIEKWNDKTMCLFAADCAERALPIFEKEHPDDDRLRKVIQASRDFAMGKISRDELIVAWDAAWDAASDTASDAASDAARAAARKWQSERILFYIEASES